MATGAERFPYLQMDPAAGAASLSPYLPVTLSLGEQPLTVMGLLDSGAAINVLPHEVGLRLGADWENQTTPVQLTGNLAASEARVLVVAAVVVPGRQAGVRLVASEFHPRHPGSDQLFPRV